MPDEFDCDICGKDCDDVNTCTKCEKSVCNSCMDLEYMDVIKTEDVICTHCSVKQLGGLTMKKKTKSSKWETVGVCGVDAGLIWLGDPCYIIGKDANEQPVETWSDFCVAIAGNDTKQFNYKGGHPGLGVCVSSGYGDGEYPVQVKRKDGRIKEVRIKFF
jgi:hypothetical protein